MAKVNYSKVEKSFDQALQRLVIDQLSDLAAIADVIQDPKESLKDSALLKLLERFQKECKKLKKQDAKLYKRLNLSPEEEKRIHLPSGAFTHEDWLFLRTIKTRIDDLKKDLYGDEQITTENEERVTKERKRHINKRFNIREGWLPLH